MAMAVLDLAGVVDPLKVGEEDLREASDPVDLEDPSLREEGSVVLVGLDLAAMDLQEWVSIIFKEVQEDFKVGPIKEEEVQVKTSQVFQEKRKVLQVRREAMVVVRTK